MRRRYMQSKAHHDLYKKGFYRALESTEVDDRVSLKKIVFYGVNTVITEPRKEYITQEDCNEQLKLLNIIKDLIGCLTPIELMQVFPVEKKYNGKKFEMKDYYSTMEIIHQLDQNVSLLHQVDMNDFLWDYQNFIISRFVLKMINAVDDHRRLQGEESMVVEFLKERGIHPVKLCTDETTGKTFVLDHNGKTKPVKTKKNTGLLRVIR